MLPSGFSDVDAMGSSYRPQASDTPVARVHPHFVERLVCTRHRAVVAACLWPSKAPITGRLSPPAAPTLAKECRRSCSRTSSSAAALRTRDQTLSRPPNGAPARAHDHVRVPSKAWKPSKQLQCGWVQINYFRLPFAFL